MVFVTLKVAKLPSLDMLLPLFERSGSTSRTSFELAWGVHFSSCEYSCTSLVGTRTGEVKGKDPTFVEESVSSMVSCLDVPFAVDPDRDDVTWHSKKEVSSSFVGIEKGHAPACYKKPLSGPVKYSGNCVNNSHL